MYGEQDYTLAAARQKKAFVTGGVVLAILLAAYAGVTVWHNRFAMLAVLLAALVFCVAWIDLMIRPAFLYNRFLRTLRDGKTRETRCRLISLEEDSQKQDGANVRALHVIPEGVEDERIFYVNASKLKHLPEMNSEVTLISTGRHIQDIR